MLHQETKSHYPKAAIDRLWHKEVILVMNIYISEGIYYSHAYLFKPIEFEASKESSGKVENEVEECAIERTSGVGFEGFEGGRTRCICTPTGSLLADGGFDTSSCSESEFRKLIQFPINKEP